MQAQSKVVQRRVTVRYLQDEGTKSTIRIASLLLVHIVGGECPQSLSSAHAILASPLLIIKVPTILPIRHRENL